MLIIKKKRFEKQRQNGSFHTVEWSIKGKRQNAHEANAGQRLLPQEDARGGGEEAWLPPHLSLQSCWQDGRPGPGACPAGPPPQKLQGPLIKRKWKPRSERTPRKAFTEVVKGNVSQAGPTLACQQRTPWNSYLNSCKTVQSYTGQELVQTLNGFTAVKTLVFYSRNKDHFKNQTCTDQIFKWKKSPLWPSPWPWILKDGS